MKSNRKPVYNHRIAQEKSTEDWETKFVSKLDAPEVKNVGNNLLYLAATKLFGARKDTYKDYYTEDNKQSIIDKIKEIANNPYNLKNHPLFEKNINSAIEQLDKEIAKNPKKTDNKTEKVDTERDGVNPTRSFGSDSITTIPGMPQPPVAPKIEKKGKKYQTNDYRKAFQDLHNVLDFPKLYPNQDPQEIIDFIQDKFLNESPGNTDIAGLPSENGRYRYRNVDPLIIKIKNYNRKWGTNLKPLVVLPLLSL